MRHVVVCYGGFGIGCSIDTEAHSQVTSLQARDGTQVSSTLLPALFPAPSCLWENHEERGGQGTRLGKQEGGEQQLRRALTAGRRLSSCGRALGESEPVWSGPFPGPPQPGPPGGEAISAKVLSAGSGQSKEEVGRWPRPRSPLGRASLHLNPQRRFSQQDDRQR